MGGEGAGAGEGYNKVIWKMVGIINIIIDISRDERCQMMANFRFPIKQAKREIYLFNTSIIDPLREIGSPYLGKVAASAFNTQLVS